MFMQINEPISKVNILLSGSPKLNYSENQPIFKYVQQYIKLTKRFS